MKSRICYHTAIFIKIVIAFIIFFIHFKPGNITYLGSGRKTPQIIHHIKAVKDKLLFTVLFYIGQVFQRYYMGVPCCKTSCLIMVVKTVQNCPINLHMVKIMNCRRCFFCPVFIQTVKAVAL